MSRSPVDGRPRHGVLVGDIVEVSLPGRSWRSRSRPPCGRVAALDGVEVAIEFPVMDSSGRLQRRVESAGMVRLAGDPRRAEVEAGFAALAAGGE